MGLYGIILSASRLQQIQIFALSQQSFIVK